MQLRERTHKIKNKLKPSIFTGHQRQNITLKLGKFNFYSCICFKLFFYFLIYTILSLSFYIILIYKLSTFEHNPACSIIFFNFSEEFVDKRDNSALESDIIEPSLDSIKEENIHDNIAVSDEEDNDMHEDFNGQDEQIDTKDGVQEQIAQQPNVPEAQNVSLSNVSVEEALKFFSA